MTIQEAKRIRWHIDIAHLMELYPWVEFRTFCECGVGPLDISAAVDVHDKRLADRILLVEPNPQLADIAAARMPRAEIKRVAIGEQAGRMNLRLNGGSSYLEGTWAPTKSSGREEQVDVITFDQIDDGRIDCLVLDCEGQEWRVLSKMRSMPMILSVEVWAGHPHESEIFGWLEKNRYKLRFTTGPSGETMVFTIFQRP